MGATQALAATVVGDPRLLEGFEYWRRKAAGRPMPCRADIDPAEIQKLLPHVRLVDAVGPGHYRYRLVGTEVRKLHGKDPTGRPEHEAIPGPVGARIIAIYDECVRTRRAIYFEKVFLYAESSGLRHRSKMVFAPLSTDGHLVNQIIVFQVALATGRLADFSRDAYSGQYKEIAYAPL
jgi:hypothetical protein